MVGQSCVLSQYNTCFWALVGSGKAPAEAQAALKVIGLSGLIHCRI